MTGTMPQSVARLLRSLEACGCHPWSAGEGIWIAPCPTCHTQGRSSLVEIRATADGVIVACLDAHEPPRPRPKMVRVSEEEFERLRRRAS